MKEINFSTLLKNIFHRNFSNFFARGLEELHFKIAFSCTPSFTKHHSTIASKVKYETAINYSAKCCSSHEKMKKCFSSHEKIHLIRNLATDTLFNKKIKQTKVSYKMNPFSAHYHLKIEESFTLPIDKISWKLHLLHLLHLLFFKSVTYFVV